MAKAEKLKLGVILFTLLSLIVWAAFQNSSYAGTYTNKPEKYEMPFGENPFAPSNAGTVHAQFIPQAEFIPAARCAECHRETHLEWSESAHRNAFREPFYQANVEHLIRDRGIAVTRHCESCHNPPALFSGALSKNATMKRPLDDEGVTCSVCHSIEQVSTEGIGSYSINTPAIMVRNNGERVQAATNQEIFDDIEAHRRAVTRPLLKSPEFCAACHKSAIIPELNGRKWFRTFSVYDEWQQSAFSTQTVQPLNKRQYQNCQSCHMPEQPSVGYKSHRWAGGNTAIPAFYGFDGQLKATADLLKSGIIGVDVIAAQTNPDDKKPVIAPLGDSSDTRNQLSARSGETIAVDVVASNRGVAHSFPAELRDMFEAWLEFKVEDADGKTVFHSGAVNDDGSLDWNAHAYRNVPIDSNGEPVTKHDTWNTRVGAIDRFIPAGRADLGRFTFVVPADAKNPLQLTAKINYRRFNKRYVDWVANSLPVKQSPVVEMSVDAKTLYLTAENTKPKEPAPAQLAAGQKEKMRVRWRTYAVALFDQQQYETAVRAFEAARKYAAQKSPEEASILTDLALCYMKMERAGASQEIMSNANEAIARAKELAPSEGRVRFYEALLNIKQFRYTEALAALETLSREFPRDRQIKAQMASLYLLQRRDREALETYKNILEIDADDTDAHFKLGGLYWRFGLFDLAKIEQVKYQPRHTDTVGETLKRDFLRKRPELYETWAWREFGDNPIGTTP
ncbi:MAG TPA: tetratricopeptide repeat protein [Pyrinomonadaceae bacterium]|jgi:tetratricopeptide (TPR) repeat protein